MNKKSQTSMIIVEIISISHLGIIITFCKMQLKINTISDYLAR